MIYILCIYEYIKLISVSIYMYVYIKVICSAIRSTPVESMFFLMVYLCFPRT